MLSKILTDTGLTQAVLAERIGVYQTTISLWINGKTLPPRTRWPVLAAALGIPLKKLARQLKSEKARRAVHAAKRNASVAP